VFIMEECGCTLFAKRGQRQWTIRDLLLHVHNIAVLPAKIWDARARYRALEEYLIKETRFAAQHATARFP
jgi:hypothetical protein